MPAMKKNLKKFRSDLENELHSREMVIRSLASQTILLSLSELIQISPVDTGLYRSNHQIRTNDIAREPIEKRREPSEIIEEEEKNISVNFGSTINISNALPYAFPLENGHSKQAPSGVYAIVRERAKTIWETLIK